VQRLPLSYRFEPGDDADGVTLTVPLEMLNTLDGGQMQWLVPGLLRDKVIALVKNLPKPLRRVFTPIPQFADAALERLRDEYPAPLLPALAVALQAISGIECDAAVFDESSLPDYLHFRVEVIDGSGEQVAVSRDLVQLQQQFGQRARRRFMDKLGQDYRRDSEADWVFGELPVSLLTKDGAGQNTRAWPGLLDQHDAVGLRLFDTAEEAALEHYHGVLRLLTMRLDGKLRDLRKHHGLGISGSLAWTAVGSVESLANCLAQSSLALLAGSRPSGIRDGGTFENLLDDVRAGLGLLFRKQSGYLDKTLILWNELSTTLDGAYAKLRPEVFVDMRSQLDDMVYDGFLQDLPAGRLEHYPRYLDAMRIRLAGVEKDPQRDADRMRQVDPFWQQYLKWLEHGRDYDDAVDTYRWLVEEFRVSLFAQQLGTRARVSAQRLHQAWQKID